ncbi:MAG: 4-hydroxythreonine-4-phosphate dehydrogenase PdxA [Verrucomicrobiae bacterium]|nr:4-hydroxythreonine-4-phosphate dehydrogenase PdxA [Verrucomicrobiae bacterium]
MRQPLAIACGDPSGIGPEVTLKAVAAELETGETTRYVLVGDRTQLEAWNRRLGIGLNLAGEVDEAAAVRVVDPRSEPLPDLMEPGSPMAAEAALDYLNAAAAGCLSGGFGGLVTAPVSKEAILRTGHAFVGQTEHLAGLAGGVEVTMLLLGDDPGGRWLRVSLATTHVPLRQVAEAVTTEGVFRAIRHSVEACGRLGLGRARIAVCGLNPHAGEGGMLGDEEGRVLVPAIERARTAGWEVVGPRAGDTVFHEAWRGEYDVVVAMYHDQGLAPLKLVAFASGVNWTLGLPFVRTSPDHGTAYDVAGRGVAEASSMRAAIRLARRLTGGTRGRCGAGMEETA